MRQSSPGDKAYWRANLRVIAVLLAIWAFVGLGLSIIFVDALNRVSIGGFPLGFWFAQQGWILVFIVLIFIYARWMGRVDRSEGRASSEEHGAVSEEEHT